MSEITQISFEGDVISASMGLWLYNNNVNMTSEGCLTASCGLFTSADESKLELAYFSNAFDRFESFSVSLFFKRSVGVAGTQSLLDNSECDVEGSVVATSASGVVEAHFANSTGAVAKLTGMVRIRQVGSYANILLYVTRFNKIEQDCHPRNTSGDSRQGSYNLLIESLLIVDSPTQVV